MASWSRRCSCKMLNSTSPLYFGEDCGIPLAIWQSSSKDSSKWQRRKQPRRLIYALPLNHEFDIFETVCDVIKRRRSGEKMVHLDSLFPLNEIWGKVNYFQSAMSIWIKKLRHAGTLHQKPLTNRKLGIYFLSTFWQRLSMHNDVVDVFIVGESNRTNSGGVKEPYFLLRFSAGWLKEWQQKLLYVFQVFCLAYSLHRKGEYTITAVTIELFF